MNVVIWLSLFENPCESGKKIVAGETLSMAEEAFWVFFTITFHLV